MAIETLDNSAPLIPESKRGAVARALAETFGVSSCDDIRILTGGLTTARIFKIVVAGRPYVLRLLMSTEANLGPGQGDPTHQFACMRKAADAGIAPRVWCTSVEDRLSIIDFVEARPGPADAAVRIAETIRRLHSIPAFPQRPNYSDFNQGLIRRFQSVKILPPSATAELFRLHDELAKVYPRDATDLVASHNDLKPENILFEGDRVWLIDWEAVFLNDRYSDLAIAANFFVKGEAETELYLQTYFGEPAGAYRCARFYLMQQVMHVTYALCFLLLAAKSGNPVDPNLRPPDFQDFHRRLATGEVSVATDEGRLQYAHVHLQQALRNMQAPRFAEAVRLVAAHRPESPVRPSNES